MIDQLDRLPAAMRPLLTRAITAVQNDQRIVGLLAGGSAAVGGMDEFSDLDLVVVCADEHHPAVLDNARAFAAELGPVLHSFTGEHVGEPRLLITLFGPPPLHVDLKFVRDRDLDDRVEDGLIVWQRGDALDAALRRADATWPEPDPQWIEDRFWVWVHYAATKIGRGELFECLDMLSFVRGTVLGPLIAQQRGRRPAGVRRLESIAPDLVPALVATVGRHDRGACLDGLRAAIDLYRKLRGANPGVEQRTGAEVASLDYLAEIEQRFGHHERSAVHGETTPTAG